jgi:hypothetical protein
MFAIPIEFCSFAQYWAIRTIKPDRNIILTEIITSGGVTVSDFVVGIFGIIPHKLSEKKSADFKHQSALSTF